MGDDAGRHLTLVVPGLPGPGPLGGAETPIRGEALALARRWWEGLSLPALTRFLSRSTRIPPLCAEAPLAGLLFGCFGVAGGGPDWPVAAVTAVLDGEDAGEDWWLRADPVHLQVDRGELVLSDTTRLQISAVEAEGLCAEINGQQDAAWPRLRALTAERWYLRLEMPVDLVTRSPWDVSGGAIGGHMPRGGDAGLWRAWLNEVQMILHGSPLNRERTARGAAPVNSVWPWGGGRMPRVPVGRWRSVSGNNPLSAGLGVLAQARTPALGDDGRAWLSGDVPPGAHLVVLDDAYVPARVGDVDAWRDFLSRFEEAWMAPLSDALGRGQIGSLRLCTGHGRDFRARRGELRRWWRRARSPARILGENR